MSSSSPSRREVLRLLSRASVGVAAGAACGDAGSDPHASQDAAAPTPAP